MENYTNGPAADNRPHPRVDVAERQRLLGGDFDADDVSWAAIAAHLLQVAHWLADLRARRAAEAGAGDAAEGEPTAVTIRDSAPALVEEAPVQ